MLYTSYRLDFNYRVINNFPIFINICKHDNKSAETDHLPEFSKSEDHNSAQNHQTRTKFKLDL